MLLVLCICTLLCGIVFALCIFIWYDACHYLVGGKKFGKPFNLTNWTFSENPVYPSSQEVDHVYSEISDDQVYTQQESPV